MLRILTIMAIGLVGAFDTSMLVKPIALSPVRRVASGWLGMKARDRVEDEPDEEWVSSFAQPPPGYECEDEEECTLDDVDDEDGIETADATADGDSDA